MSLVGTAIESKRLLQDLILWMADNERRYCCTAISIHNATGAAVAHVIGEVISDATLAPEAAVAGLQPAFTDAILMANVSVPAGKTVSVPALVRGPAIVNFDELERADGESDATLKARLDAMIVQGVRFIRHPTSVTQTDLNS